MAYPGSFLRLVMAGPLYDVERWSTSLSLVNWSGAATTDPTTVPAGVLSAIETFLNNSWVAGIAQLDSVKLNRIGTDGRYTSNTTVEHIYTGTKPKGGAATVYPAPQLAFAVSLISSTARGLANRGRFYLPAFALPANVSDGRVSVAAVGSIVTAATTFVNSLNTALNPYKVSVVSNVREGAFREVQAVSIGRVIDTIRSRRAQMDEGYSVGSTLTGFGANQFTGGGGTF